MNIKAKLIVATINKLKRKVWPHILKTSQVWSIFFFSICLLMFLIATSTSAFSTILKTQGNKAYKNQNYSLALEKFETARNWWLAEKISLRLRDRDLYTKIHKAKLMVDSGNSYQTGLEAFEGGDYESAKRYLGQLVENDPNYQDAQTKLSICLEKLETTFETTRLVPQTTIKPTTKPTPPSFPKATLTPTYQPTIQITLPSFPSFSTSTPTPIQTPTSIPDLSLLLKQCLADAKAIYGTEIASLCARGLCSSGMADAVRHDYVTKQQICYEKYGY